MTPEVGSTIRLIIRSEVVLPQPEGPTKTVMEPLSMDMVELVHGRLPALVLLGDALELDHGLVHSADLPVLLDGIGQWRELVISTLIVTVTQSVPSVTSIAANPGKGIPTVTIRSRGLRGWVRQSTCTS